MNAIEQAEKSREKRITLPFVYLIYDKKKSVFLLPASCDQSGDTYQIEAWWLIWGGGGSVNCPIF